MPFQSRDHLGDVVVVGAQAAEDRGAGEILLTSMDGDGTMEAQRTEIEPQLMIPRWVLFRW